MKIGEIFARAAGVDLKIVGDEAKAYKWLDIEPNELKRLEWFKFSHSNLTCKNALMCPKEIPVGCASTWSARRLQECRTTPWMEEVEYCLDTHKDVSGRVASGTKTEQLSSSCRATLFIYS